MFNRCDGPNSLQFVDASAVQDNPYQCPTCKGHDVVLEGSFRRSFRERFLNGMSLDLQSEQQVCKNIEAILCNSCDIRHVILPDSQGNDLPISPKVLPTQQIQIM